MAVITRQEVIPTPVENATVVKAFVDGVHRQYEITPNAGYVLHDKVRDWTETDFETGEEIVKLGYTTINASCPATYDFVANPREFYTAPADSVPADQIFGVSNDHEVM